MVTKQYFIQNTKDGKLLDTKGEWVSSDSYRLAVFDSEDAATAAIPKDAKARVFAKVARPERPERRVAPQLLAAKAAASTASFYLRLADRYLDTNGEFKARMPFLIAANSGYKGTYAMPFDSEAAALDKAEELKLDLSSITVVQRGKPSGPAQSQAEFKAMVAKFAPKQG